MKFSILLFALAIMIATINAATINVARNTGRHQTEMQFNFLQQKMSYMIMRRQHYANKLFF